MSKISKRIEIVVTDIDGLTLMPKNTCKMIYKVLQKYYTKPHIVTINNNAELESLIKRAPDLVFLGIKCIKFKKHNITNDSADKIWLSEYLDKAGIRYTGSSKEALQLEFNKSKAKKKMESSKINTSPFFLAKPNQFTKTEGLPIAFPLFIKPIYEGDGRGIAFDSIVHDFKSYKKKVKNIFKEFKTSALVEKYLGGREFTVGIIDNGLGNLIEMPLELIAIQNDQGDRILGEQEKNEDNEKTITIKDDKIYKEICTLAKKSFQALGAKDFGRIDIRMNEKGVPYFLEANLIPGLGSGYFSRACHVNQKMSYEDMILRIVELGLKK